MKTLRLIAYSLTLLFGLFTTVTFTGCSDDEEAPVQQYGYVQFKLYKEASRAASQLEHLRDAHKIKVLMQHDGLTIEQTLLLNATNDTDAEHGLRSDKLKLLTGDYTVVGFYLYDIMDKEIMSCGVEDTDRNFTVLGGGLTMHSLYCDVQPRGMARFMLVKDMDSRADGADYPFANIRTADITVRNQSTRVAYQFKNMPMTLKTSYGEQRGQYLWVDTIVSLPAGEYKVESYVTYSDTRGRNMLGADNAATQRTFTVTDNRLTDSIPCPIRLNMAAEHIKDYLALHEIWKALGGPGWRFVGMGQTPGCNWNFDKDIDMWGDQPGVDLDKNGRVTGISLVGFAPKGDVPDAIGQLTELEVIYLGAHDEVTGGNVQNLFHTGASRTSLDALRQDYKNQVLARDPMQSFSECIQTAMDRDDNHESIHRYQRLYLYDTHGGVLTNQITGISRAIMRCNKLTQIFIANAPIKADGFFRPIKPDSPFYDQQDTLSFRWFENLTDIEIYNCPRLERLPDFLKEVDGIISLNISQLRGIPGDQLLADWKDIIKSPSGKTIQLLFLGYNNLTQSPSHEELAQMVKLGLIDITHNKLTRFEPFGKGVALVDAYFDFNQLTELVPADDGYFCNCSDIETFSCAHNKLTKVPNIFNAKNVYTIGDVDFSYNHISDFDTEHGTYKGINASTVNLSNNYFERFPKELFHTGSPIRALNLAGNKIREIKEGEMTGEKSYLLRSLDMQMNKLSGLCEDFYATNIPYLYGIDLSYNQLDHFPYTVLDCQGLTVLALRHQRDADGNRTLKEWPTGIGSCPSLLALYMGGNDLRKIDDTISPNIYIFEIKDNPNISLTLPAAVCQYIAYGYYLLIYDPTQDIRGCDDYLDLE